MRVVGIIPERMNSSRFPGKPLAKILGKPMVQHVYENSIKSDVLDDVYVATGDQEIIDCVHGFDGEIIRTRSDHFRASNQASEALGILEASTGNVYDVVCMIQGDEPMVNSDMIYQSVKPLIDNEHLQVTNLMGVLSVDDVNEVKVVTDRDGFALYFSRCGIPNGWDGDGGVLWKQVCVIGFRREMLRFFPLLPECSLERCESVDMLRLLVHGVRVLMVPIKYKTFSVDTKRDLEHVESILKGGGGVG